MANGIGNDLRGRLKRTTDVMERSECWGDKEQENDKFLHGTPHIQLKNHHEAGAPTKVTGPAMLEERV